MADQEKRISHAHGSRAHPAPSHADKLAIRSIFSVLRLLIDTSAWLDLAMRRDGQKRIVPLRVFLHQGKLEPLVPLLVIEEFEHHRPRSEAPSPRACWPGYGSCAESCTNSPARSMSMFGWRKPSSTSRW